jgi:hypothetical protein
MAMPRITAFNDLEPFVRTLGAEWNRAKKMVEEVDAGYFLEACSLALDRELAVLSSSERRDFVYAASDGSTVGLELVKIVRDPQSKWADEVFFGREHQGAYGTWRGALAHRSSCREEGVEEARPQLETSR